MTETRKPGSIMIGFLLGLLPYAIAGLILTVMHLDTLSDFNFLQFALFTVMLFPAAAPIGLALHAVLAGFLLWKKKTRTLIGILVFYVIFALAFILIPT